MMKSTQTTAAMPDSFFRSLCGCGPKVKRLRGSVVHRPARTCSYGIFIVAIALSSTWLAAPTTTSAQTWNGAGWGSWQWASAAWSNYQAAANVGSDPSTPTPSETAPSTDSTATNTDATASDSSATTDTANGTADTILQPLVQTILPTTVTALMATDTSSSQVTLRWNASTDIGGLGLSAYLVFRNGILIGTTTATVFADTTVAANTPYCYTIIAVDLGGNDALSSAEACVTTSSPPQGNPTAPGFYVDYSAGADSNPGTNAAAPWKHCPGDPAATSVAASTQLAPGNTVFFKGGVTYVLSPQNGSDTSANQGGIVLNWNGATGNPITYTCTNAWGTGRAVFTDGYSANWICAFYAPGTVSDLVFNNLEIGPVGGSASLPADPGSAVPPKPGAGILSNGMLVNVTIANCYFHQLGYWFNQQPMSESSIWGEGVQCIDYIGLTITNCEFTEVGIACELPIENVSSNLTIAHCDFHDAIVWCIDLAHSDNGCSLSGVTIVGNTFSNYCQQWNNWTGYGGWPHSDGIFDRADQLTTFTDGANNNFYNNVFFDSETGASTAAIFLEGGVSANIYNNLFSTVNSVPIEPHNDGQNAITSTNFLVRVYNNTFYEVDNVHLYPWGGAGVPFGVWRTATGAAQQLDVKNNIFYDVGGSDTILTLDVTNTAAAYPGFKFDYDCYFSSSEQFVSQATTDSTSTNTDLGGLHGYGWETHGIANPASVFADATSTSYSITNNYSLKTGSPCIGAGANLNSLNLPGLNANINGVPRSTTGNWNLGAY
jgi:hypothetical protein